MARMTGQDASEVPASLEGGITRKVAEQLRALAAEFGLALSFRLTSPDSVAWNRHGRAAVPKPAEIKVKSATEADAHLGVPRALRGLVAYYRPSFPRVQHLPLGEQARIWGRYVARLTEFIVSAPDLKKVEASFRLHGTHSIVTQRMYVDSSGAIRKPAHTGPDGTVRDAEGNQLTEKWFPITADHDLMSITDLEGNPVSTERKDAFLERAWDSGVRHGALLDWEPDTVEGRELMDSIVNSTEEVLTFAADVSPFIETFPIGAGVSAPQDAAHQQDEAATLAATTHRARTLDAAYTAYEAAASVLNSAVTDGAGAHTGAQQFLTAGWRLRTLRADSFRAWGQAADALPHLSGVLRRLRQLLPPDPPLASSSAQGPAQSAHTDSGMAVWRLGALIQAYDRAGGMEAARAVAGALATFVPPETEPVLPSGTVDTRMRGAGRDASQDPQPRTQAVIDTYKLGDLPPALVIQAFDAYTALRPAPVILDAHTADRDRAQRALDVRAIVENTQRTLESEFLRSVSDPAAREHLAVQHEAATLVARAANDAPRISGDHGTPSHLPAQDLHALHSEVLRHARTLWNNAHHTHDTPPPREWNHVTPAWVTTHWTRLTSTERQLPLTTQAGLIAPHALGQPTPVVPGGAKKKKNKTPQADQNTASTSQNPPRETAPAVSESLKQEIRTFALALPSPLRDPERLIGQVADMITRHPQPKDVLVRTVVAFMGRFSEDHVLGLAFAAHPPVLYTLLLRAQATRDVRGEGLLDVLALSTRLIELLSEAPSLLDWLVEVPAGFYTTDPAALVEALLRPGTVERLESDPLMRYHLDQIRSAPGLLARMRGRMDVVEAILAIHGSNPYAPAVAHLVQISPSFASALVDREDAEETVWRLGADLTLMSALYNVAWRFPDALTPAFSRELLDRPEEWPVFALLRAYPSTATLLMASADIRSAATERPEALHALAEAPELIDSLEDNPALASRLLSQPNALAAAFDLLRHVTDALAVDPNRYDEVPDDGLARALHNTPDLTPPEYKKEVQQPNLREPVATARLMQYLRATSPAWNLQISRSDLGRKLLVPSKNEKFWNKLLHIAAWNPTSATPNGIRRAFTQNIGHDLHVDESDNNPGLWSLLELGFRHQLIGILRNTSRQRITNTASMLENEREGYPRLYHSPADAARYGPQILIPTQSLARWTSHIPAAAALHMRSAMPFLDHREIDENEGFVVGNAALLRLVHRHPGLINSFSDTSWKTIPQQVQQNPQLLQSLMPLYGKIHLGHWITLLKHPWLYRRMAQHMDKPSVQALIAHPELLMSALARPDFPAAWDTDRDKFDSLAALLLHQRQAPGQAGSSEGPSQDPYKKLAEAIAETGLRTIADNGVMITPGKEKLVYTTHAALLARKPVDLTPIMKELNFDPSYMAEVSENYEIMLNDDSLRLAAVSDLGLTAQLISTRSLITLLRKRPTLLAYMQRRPEAAKAISQRPELRELLTVDDQNFEVFTQFEVASHYTSALSKIALSVPSYPRAHFLYGFVTRDMTHGPSVLRLMQSSEAISRAVVTFGNDVLRRLDLTLTETLLQIAGQGERSENVFRTMLARPERLQASSESPYLVAQLADRPSVAKYLSDHPEVLSGPGQWQAVLGSHKLLEALEQRPEVLPLTLETGVLELALASPGLVEVLHRAPVGVRRAMVTGWRGDLLREQPELLTRLVTDEDWPVVFLWLPEELRRQPGVLREFLETPGLVSVVRRTRVLVRTLAENGEMWRLMVRHPALAAALGSSARSHLARHGVLRQRIAALPVVDGDAAPQLAEALGIAAVAALLSEESEPLAGFALRFLSEPLWQARAVADRDFSGSVKALSNDDPGRLSALTAPGVDAGDLLAAIRPATAVLPASRTGVVGRDVSEKVADTGSGRVTPAASSASAQTGEAERSTVPARPVTGSGPAAPSVSEAVLELLAGPQGARVAGAIGTHPVLLPLMNTSDALVEQLALDPGAVRAYAASTYLDGRLPRSEEEFERLADGDPAGLEAILGTAERHLDGYLASVDIAPASTEHRRQISAAFQAAWHESADRVRSRIADVHRARAERFATFSPAEHMKWDHGERPRLHFARNLSNADFAPADRARLLGIAAGAVSAREAQTGINVALHAHVDGGSGGVSYFYALAADGKVDTVVYGRSTKRSGNKYSWERNGQYTDGPLPIDAVANHPLLTRSIALGQDNKVHAARLTAIAGQIAAATRPARPEAHAAQSTARLLARAVKDYHQQLGALQASGSTAPTVQQLAPAALGLLRAVGELRGLGADILAHTWHTASDETQAQVLAHATTTTNAGVVDPDPDGDTARLGALALAWQAAGEPALRAVADAWTTAPVTPERPMAPDGFAGLPGAGTAPLPTWTAREATTPRPASSEPVAGNDAQEGPPPLDEEMLGHLHAEVVREVRRLKNIRHRPGTDGPRNDIRVARDAVAQQYALLHSPSHGKNPLALAPLIASRLLHTSAEPTQGASATAGAETAQPVTTEPAPTPEPRTAPEQVPAQTGHPAPVTADTPAEPTPRTTVPGQPWRGLLLPLNVIRHRQVYTITELTGLSEDSPAYTHLTDGSEAEIQHETIQHAVQRAAAAVLQHLPTLSPPVTLTNADLRVTVPEQQPSLWLAIAQGLANELNHRVTVQRPDHPDINLCPPTQEPSRPARNGTAQ
nr:hypothetical protein OHA15_39960 [Streptomyces anthocyanicus]